MNNPGAQFAITVAAVAVVVLVGLYIAQHFHYGCFFGNCVGVLTK